MLKIYIPIFCSKTQSKEHIYHESLNLFSDWLMKKYVIIFSLNYFYRDSREIRSTMNTKIIQEDKTCILKTLKFSKADIGTYKCVATNSAGTAECEAKVEGKLAVLKYLL